MHESKVFSVARAWYALRADLHQQSRAVLVAAGGGAALILAVNVISAANPFGCNFHAVFFPLALLIGGHLFTKVSGCHCSPRGWHGSCFRGFQVNSSRSSSTHASRKRWPWGQRSCSGS